MSFQYLTEYLVLYKISNRLWAKFDFPMSGLTSFKELAGKMGSGSNTVLKDLELISGDKFIMKQLELLIEVFIASIQ